ncbi:unnamed protein product [Symbiodinium natans]|uniref:Uncharacterized protein n=1 Tax=Symbiodinium natans TaxID=878477 RepID=A0A812JW97_9DINO|nr:unnamed protein product [Symbiodinium natans]
MAAICWQTAQQQDLELDCWLPLEAARVLVKGWIGLAELWIVEGGAVQHDTSGEFRVLGVGRDFEGHELVLGDASVKHVAVGTLAETGCGANVCVSKDDWSVLDKLAEGATAMIDVPGTLTLCESVLEHNPRARAWSFYSMLARSDRPETLFFKMPRHKSLHWITFARHWWLQALCLVLEGTRNLSSIKLQPLHLHLFRWQRVLQPAAVVPRGLEEAAACGMQVGPLVAELSSSVNGHGISSQLHRVTTGDQFLRMSFRCETVVRRGTDVKQMCKDASFKGVQAWNGSRPFKTPGAHFAQTLLVRTLSAGAFRLQPQMTRVSDGLVHAQEPTYADHGLAFRMQRDARNADEGLPKAKAVPTPSVPKLLTHLVSTLVVHSPTSADESRTMRRSQVEGYEDIPDIPVTVKNTFVHFVEGGPVCGIVERWSSCPANLEPSKIQITSVATARGDGDDRDVESRHHAAGRLQEQQRRAHQADQPGWGVGLKTQSQPHMSIPDADEEPGEVFATRAQELRLSKTINREITHAASKGKVKAVLDVTWSRLMSMNGVNLATALHRIARHSSEDPSQTAEVHKHPGFGPMMKAIERKARFALESGQDSNSAEAQSAGFPAQCASIIAWSCATLSVRDEGMLAILAELAGPRLRELKPYEVTNLIWAFAKLSVPCGPLYQNAAKMLQTRQRGEYKAQCLSAAIWSFAQSAALSRTAQAQLFKSIGDEMVPQVSSLKPQEMANTVWSFGHVRVKHQRLFEEICGAFANSPGASRFSIPQLTSILVGCAQVHFHQPEVIGRISAVLLRNSHVLTAEQLSSVLWSLAELDARDRVLLVQKLLDMAAADLTSFNHEDLHTVMAAARTLCPQHRVFFDACKAIFGEDRSRDGAPLHGILEDSEEE